MAGHKFISEMPFNVNGGITNHITVNQTGGQMLIDARTYNAEIMKHKGSEEGGVEKSKTSPEYDVSERAAETPFYGTDDEAGTESTDEGIVATDEDQEEEVEAEDDKEEQVKSKDEKPKSKIVSKIPRIVITDDTRRQDDDRETKNLSKIATKIPRRP